MRDNPDRAGIFQGRSVSGVHKGGEYLHGVHWDWLIEKRAIVTAIGSKLLGLPLPMDMPSDF